MAATDDYARGQKDVIEAVGQLKQYNCDCLPNGPDGKTMATDEQAMSDDCVSCERQVVLVEDLYKLFGKQHIRARKLSEFLTGDPDLDHLLQMFDNIIQANDALCDAAAKYEQSGAGELPIEVTDAMFVLDFVIHGK